MALRERGVDHRDVSIGNVFLGTDPSKPAGFIADLDLSSISDEAIKAAYPTEHEVIISKLKHGEWRTVCVSQVDLVELSLIVSLGDSSFHVSGSALRSRKPCGCQDVWYTKRLHVSTQALSRFRIADLGYHLCYDASEEEHTGNHGFSRPHCIQGAT